MEGGLTIEAAVDFTGGIPEMIDLTELKMSQDALFRAMQHAERHKGFLGCAVNVRRQNYLTYYIK